MAQGLYGSICIEDLFGAAIQKDGQGNSWVNLSALQGSAIKRGERNGKTYINIGVWINDQLDQYGNIASMSISQSQEERQSGEKRVYIGNLKMNGQQQAAPQPVQQAAPVAATPWGGQPVQQQYPQAPQQQYPQQGYYPQQTAAAPVQQFPQQPAAPASQQPAQFPQQAAAPVGAQAAGDDLPF